MLTPWKKNYDQAREHIEKQRHYFANKGPSSQGYGFPSGHVWMWELYCEESWAPKNWCFWTVMLEKTLENPLDCKEIQPVHSEGNQPWDFFGRNDAKAETPVLWPPHAKCWLIGKDSDAGRDRGQEEKGMTEDEKAGCHHWLDGQESEWTLRVGDGQGGLAYCDSWVSKSWTRLVTELNWTDWHTALYKFKIHSIRFDSHIPWIDYYNFCLHSSSHMEFSTWLSGKVSICNVGDLSSIPESERSPGKGNGNPLQYTSPGNPTDRGGWWVTFHRVAKESDTT